MCTHAVDCDPTQAGRGLCVVTLDLRREKFTDKDENEIV